MRRFALIAAVVFGLVATMASGASASPSPARAIIPGCQTITMNDSVPPFAASVTWIPTENGHHYGAYRVSGGCGQTLTAELLGIGPDSSPGRCAILYAHVQNNDGSWYRTSTVHDCAGGSSVRLNGMMPINHHFYLHCADSDRDPQENQPCRVRFRF